MNKINLNRKNIEAVSFFIMDFGVMMLSLFILGSILGYLLNLTVLFWLT